MSRAYPARPPRSAVGRADLLRALALRELDALTLDDDGDAWFGYRRRPTEPPALRPIRLEITDTDSQQAEATPAPTGWRPPLRMNAVLAIVHRQTRPAPEAPPAGETFSPLDDASAAPRSSHRLIGYEDLIPAARLLPALRRWLGAVRPGPPDLDRLARRLAVADPPRQLPRQRLSRWHPELVVVLDFSPRLWPYREDLHRLAERLLQRCGQSGVSLRIVERGPPGAWTDWRDEQNPARAAPARDWLMPPAGTPVLLVGDAGLLLGAGSELAQRWRAFVERLRQARLRPLALVPLGAGQLDAGLTRGLPVLRWSPDARLRPECAHGPGQPEPEGLDDLLAMAAVARRLDPPLLRALRRLHPATPLNAGLEGAFWRHPAVESGRVAQLGGPDRPGYLDRFRRLAPGLQRQLDGVRAHHHAHLRAVLHHEETLAFAAHADPALLSDPDMAAAVAESVAFMRRLAATLAQAESAPNAAGWREAARGIENRADATMAERGKDWLLPLAAARMRRDRAQGRDPVAPDWADPAELAKTLPPGPTVEAWLVRDAASASLVLQDHPAGPRQIPVGPLDAPLTLDAGGLSVRFGAEPSRWRAVDRLPLRLADLDTASTFRLETSRETLVIAPVVRPRGLASWGCYRGGLHLDTPRLGEQSATFNSEHCTVIDSGGFHLTGRWGEEPGWPVSSQVHLNFGLDAPHGVHADLTLETPHGRATQRLRWIEPGTFWMGSPEDEPERYTDEGPRHRVTLTRGFWLADTACTQALWRAVQGDNPSHFTGDPERPVEQVDWRRVQVFLRALEGLLPGVRADLPTEAEWEYACRAGTATPFSFGATITPAQVNYDGNHPYAGGARGLYRETTVPVKSLPANPWGLYGMHGNVWEWCADGQRAYTAEPIADPVGPLVGDETPRVVRGGSWYDYAGYARSAYRSQLVPDIVDSFLGFRLCLRSIGPGPDPARRRRPQGTRGRSGRPARRRMTGPAPASFWEK